MILSISILTAETTHHRQPRDSKPLDHYSFKELDHAIFSESLISIAVPIDIFGLYSPMNHTQLIAKHLKSEASKHKLTTAGKFLGTLERVSFSSYQIIYDKFNTIRYFFSENVIGRNIKNSKTQVNN